MNLFNIVNREMMPEEIDKVNTGFDQLMLEEGLEIEKSERITYVALDKNTFIGCLSGLIYKNGDNYSGWFYLTDLFVDEKYRSQGLGADLLETLEKKAIIIGIKNIWLWTSGFKAIKFYRRHGYKEFANMESWYSDGSSRVGLRKSLTESMNN